MTPNPDDSSFASGLSPILSFACLTLCMLSNFSRFFCRLLIYFIIFFFENTFSNTVRVSNSLGPDKAGRFVGPDPSLNCFHMLSIDDT